MLDNVQRRLRSEHRWATIVFRSVPTWSLAEQRAIADYLDAETARIDALIAKKQQLIHLLEERFEAGLEDQLKTSPQSVPIKRLVTKIGSGSTPLGGADSYVEQGIPLLRSQNIVNGEVDLAGVARVERGTHERMRATRVLYGDVLLNITGGSIGRSAVYALRDEANVNQHVCILRPRPGISPNLLQASLATRSVQEQIRLVQVGGNREGLNFEQVGNLLVDQPAERSWAERQIAELRRLTSHALASLARQVELLAEHKQALVTAAVADDLFILSNR